jgi:hypothetical protein
VSELCFLYGKYDFFTKKKIRIEFWAHFFWRASPAKKNRAFRYKSSEAPMRFLWAFRYYPLRSGSSELCHGIAAGNSVGA